MEIMDESNIPLSPSELSPVPDTATSGLCNADNQCNLSEQNEEDIEVEDEGSPMGKANTDFEVVQKFRQDINVVMGKKSLTSSKAEEQQAPSSDRPSLSGSKKAPGLFEKLHCEELKKQKPRFGSPMSRKLFLEKEQLKECAFVPKLGERTVLLSAKRRPPKGQYYRVDEDLTEDANKRAAYRKQLVLNDWDSCRRSAERSKMSENSCKISRGKFEKDIETVLRLVDVNNTRRLSYDMLGRFMRLVGIYAILYNEGKHGGLHAKPVGEGRIECSGVCRHSKDFLQRVAKENVFHANIWRMLNVLNCGYVNSEILKDLMLMLYESNTVPVGTLASQIATLLKEGHDSFPCDDIEQRMVKHCPRMKEVFWTPVQLINAFRDLARISFSASTAKIMRTKALEKVDVPKYDFAPKISPRSQVLAESQLKKFVESSAMSRENDDADCNSHEVADERHYSSPSEKFDPMRSKSSEGQRLSNTSTSIISSTNGKLEARIKLLYDKRRRSLDRLEQIRADERRQLRKMCPFKPNISTTSYRSRQNSVSSSHSQAAKKKRELPKSYEDRELEACTFSPKIKRLGVRKNSGARRARSKSPTPSTMSRGDVVVEVLIGAGKKGELLMMKGERPEEVAKRFAKKYGLGQDAAALLKNLLQKELSEQFNSRCQLS